MPQDQAIHKAAHKEEAELVEELVTSGQADVNALGAQNRTALHKAVGKGNLKIVTFLLEHGADVGKQDAGGLTPLHWASLFGFLEVGEALVEAKADLNAKTNSGETPLHLAAEKGKLEFARMLVDRGADLTVVSNGSPGKTAFDVAKKAGHKDIANIVKPPNAPGGCCVIL